MQLWSGVQKGIMDGVSFDLGGSERSDRNVT